MSNNLEEKDIKTNNKKKKINFRLIVGCLLLIASAALFSLKPIENKIISSNIDDFTKNKNKIMKEISTTVISEDIKLDEKKQESKNESMVKKKEDDKQNSNINFDFNNVSELDFNTIRKAKANVDFSSAYGAIAIPAVDISIPIFKGLNNYNLTYGAGTMKEEQTMGEDNYTLAGHNYPENPAILFSPLKHISSGDKILTTDFRFIYVYNTTGISMITPDRVDVLNDHEGKKEITLITCDETGNKRYLVKGDFEYKIPVTLANKELKDSFGFDL